MPEEGPGIPSRVGLQRVGPRPGPAHRKGRPRAVAWLQPSPPRVSPGHPRRARRFDPAGDLPTRELHAASHPVRRRSSPFPGLPGLRRIALATCRRDEPRNVSRTHPSEAFSIAIASRERMGPRSTCGRRGLSPWRTASAVMIRVCLSSSRRAAARLGGDDEPPRSPVRLQLFGQDLERRDARLLRGRQARRTRHQRDSGRSPVRASDLGDVDRSKSHRDRIRLCKATSLVPER